MQVRNLETPHSPLLTPDLNVSSTKKTLLSNTTATATLGPPSFDQQEMEFHIFILVVHQHSNISTWPLRTGQATINYSL